MDERDIWLTANLMLKQHGADALIHAAMRADELAARGDTRGEQVWKRIVRALRELTAMQPPGKPH